MSNLITKTNIVRKHLLEGKYITSLMAYQPEFRTNTRLSASIFMLRDEGMDIKTGSPDTAFVDGVMNKETRDDMVSRSSCKNYAVYYIIPSKLEEQRAKYSTAV